jgi:hypothetical protein
MRFLFFLLLPISIFSQLEQELGHSVQVLVQVASLKPEFRNLSWFINKKSAEVVTTLSSRFGSDSLRKTDSIFVSQDRYNLYYDSLTLWNLTKNAYKKKSTKAKASLVGDFSEAKTVHSNKEWIKIYDNVTRDAYVKNKNSTVGENSCIPSTYSNLKFFYEKEPNAIKSYNHGRIKVYQNSSTEDYDNKEYNIHIHDTLKFYLVFHQSIQPIDNHGVSYYGAWLPYMYFYEKPKKVVYPASVKKLWETKTGLPYSIAQELQLTDAKILEIISLPSVFNADVLITKTIDKITQTTDRQYNISVKCDTCDVKLFDNQTEDSDIVNFTYKDKTEQVEIKSSGVNYKILLSEDNSFYLLAISEGSYKTCTVDAIIDGGSHVFVLKKGEKILIKLHKI